jgi:hypothetical protein
MAHTKKELAEKITELSSGHWAAASEPLLLSQLGPDLSVAGFNYKEILDGQGLRHFIDNEVNELTIAKHPQQYAKVGVHPAKVSFSYADAPAETKPEPSGADKLKKSRRAFYGFIQAISDLPPQEIEAINIPTRVIVRLLEGK